MENLFIGIAGMIGAGKSTLATSLAQHLGIKAYYEPVENMSIWKIIIMI